MNEDRIMQGSGEAANIDLARASGCRIASRVRWMLLFLVVIGIFLYRGADRYVETGSFLSRRYEVLRRLDAIDSLLKDEQLAVREFLLTGKDAAVKSIAAIHARIDQACDELFREKPLGNKQVEYEGLIGKEWYLDIGKLARDERGDQCGRVETLKNEAQALHAHTKSIIDAAGQEQSSRSAAQEMLVSTERKKLESAVQDALAEIRTIEQAMLDARLEQIREAAALLGDVVVYIHLLYVGIVTVGLPLVILGAIFRWQWTRNPWFRFTHLVMILIVVVEAVSGIPCPLTVWEQDLKMCAGIQFNEGSFMGAWVHRLIIYDNANPVEDEKYFTAAYVIFGTAVLASFWFWPPRLRKKRGPRAA